MGSEAVTAFTGAPGSTHAIKTPGSIYTEKGLRILPFGATGGVFSGVISGTKKTSAYVSVVGSPANFSPALSVLYQGGPNAGDYGECVLHGNFPNSNAKTLLFTITGGEIVNFGSVTDIGEFSIFIHRVNMGAGAVAQWHFRYISNTQTICRFFAGNNNADAPAYLKATTTVAGDVIIRANLEKYCLFP